MPAAGGRREAIGSSAPESDKHVCLQAQRWTLYCPSLQALTGTGGGGEGWRRRVLGAPQCREEEELGESSGGSGQSKIFWSPARSLWTSALPF